MKTQTMRARAETARISFVAILTCFLCIVGSGYPSQGQDAGDDADSIVDGSGEPQDYGNGGTIDVPGLGTVELQDVPAEIRDNLRQADQAQFDPPEEYGDVEPVPLVEMDEPLSPSKPEELPNGSLEGEAPAEIERA